MNNALKLGLILAAFSVAVTLLVYLIDTDILFNWKFQLIMFIANIIVVIALGRKFLRPKDYVGLSYGEALKYLFVAFLISTTISQVAGIALFSNNESVKTAYTEYSEKSAMTGATLGMRLGGASESEIEMKKEEIKDQIESGEIPTAPYPYEWSFLPLSLLSGIFGALIMSLIFAIFVKQKG